MKMKTLAAILLLALHSCAQNNDALIKDINNKLAKGKTTISTILGDPSSMSLHSLTAFRDMIKQNAKAEKIKLVTDNEPGTRITVKGIVLDKTGAPQPSLLVYVYQTSSEGWYSDTAPHILTNEGDRRHARLFGYFKTDATGKFEFETIKPKGYPHSSLPAHIHIEIVNANGSSLISELLFDDDPRLVGDIRARAIQEHFVISKNMGTAVAPVYTYTLKID